MTKVTGNQNLKTCPITELSPLVEETKNTAQELADLEGDVALREINIFQGKVTKTFGKIEQKIIDLNDARFKLTDEELMDFDDLTHMH